MYSDINEMAHSGSLVARIIACVATQEIDNPPQWTNEHIYSIVSQPNWDVKWSYAKDTYQVNVNPDTGARTDVISDGDILAAVQAVIAAENVEGGE